jgi:hypothetical protein
MPQKIRNVFKKRVIRYLPKKIITLIYNIYRLNSLEKNLKEPYWLRVSMSLSQVAKDFEQTVFVGSDALGAIAVNFIVDRYQKKSLFWFDAHEIYSEQKWVENMGGINTLEKLENRAVKSSDFFSCVHESATTYLSNRAKRVGESFSISNATQKVTLPKSKSHYENFDYVIGFMGGLSELRGVFEFCEAALLDKNQLLRIVLFGWDPDPRLLKLASIDSRLEINKPVPTEQVLPQVAKFNCIVLPYPVIDLNTKLAFPNKLGDAIALEIPVIFNRELEEVSRLNALYTFGASFEVTSNIDQMNKSIIEAINNVKKLHPNWNKIENEIGYSQNLNVLNDLLVKIENLVSSTEKNHLNT